MKYLSLLLTTCLVFFLSPKNTNATISIDINSVPSSIEIDQEFIADVIFNCSGCGTSYLRGVFFYPDSSTSYSGYTQNNSNEWVNISGTPSNYFKVDSGSWNGQMKFKFDPEKPSGEYYFKLGRYTASGTSFSKTSGNIIITIVSPPPTSTSTETVTVTETPTATPTTTTTQTPTPTPTKSIYTINKPKDQDGQFISSVKIYIDTFYTHHLDNEVFEFCDVCFCDTAKTISCGFGEHTIKLTKSGYSDWSEQRTIYQGQNYETTPILTKLSESTPTLTSTSTPTPTKTSTPTKTPTPTLAPRSPQGEMGATISAVLGESTSSASISSEYVASQEPTPSPEIKVNKKTNFKNTFFIGLFLSVSSGALLYFRLRKD